MNEIDKSNTFANQLLGLIRNAKTETECRELAKKYEPQFKKLREINPARAQHIVNLTGMRRREFAQEQRGPF